ncbi:acyltransferase family protein [Microlunatus speluncae]|uniref:acyltransferase family protein n=1 Tax=Microlunatus speluncae TaxID=2594267 RepID=UPI001266718C|nr:acyltransferase family protein [Microlunatus speluncae]
MTSATEEVRARPATRLAFVDNLRVWLTVLVVAHHVALVYGNLPVWPNWEPPPSPPEGLPLDGLVLLNQAYFMGFFFLLSGFVTPGSLDRKGSTAFAVDRLRRLGIPFLIFVVALRPLYTLPTYLALPAADRPPYWSFYLTEADLGPMWFLEVLLIFALGYVLLRRIRPARPRPVIKLRAWHVIMFALALGVVSWVWRMVVPVGTYVPIVGLPSAAYLPQYLSLYVVGVLAYRNDWLRNLPRRAGLLGLGLIIASVLPMIMLGGYLTLDLVDPPPPSSVAHLGFALWDSLFALGMITVLLVLFQRFVTGQGPAARWLAGNAYAVYLVHAPIIVGVAAALHPVALTPVLKFLIALPVALLLSWLAGSLLRRLPGLRSVL